jgi:prolyl-tRNA synthetase
MDYTAKLAADLRKIRYAGRRVTVELDDRDIGGTRNWDWIKKGVPLRVEIGPRDIAKDAVFVGRRDKTPREKTSMARSAFITGFTELLDEIQGNLLQRAKDYCGANSRIIDDRDEFDRFFTPENPEKPEIHGGFAHAHWCGADTCEERIKTDLSVTLRCLPLAGPKEAGACICCGKPSEQRAIFAKAY